jgi:hypothetical protein
MSEMSLVDKARKIDRRKQIIVTSDEVDLAIDNGDLHIERKSWMNLPASESQKTIYDEAREVYRVLEGDPEIRWVDFFEYLCAEYTLRYKAEARERMKR